MQYTTNYGLTKLELSDSPADITEINTNWETIDEKLKEHADMLDGTTGSIAFTNKENTFTNRQNFLQAFNLINKSVEVGVVPSNDQFIRFDYKDKNEKSFGYFQVARRTTGKREISFRLMKEDAAAITSSSIELFEQADGTAVATCPTPPTSSDTNEIATTEWVRDRIPELAPEPDLSEYVKSVNNVTPDPETGNVQIEIPDFVPSGTKMLFYEAAAPTGWTIDKSVNDAGIRIVSSNGGTVGGSTAFSSIFKSGTIATSSTSVTISGNTGNRQLTVAMLARHNHTYRGHTGNGYIGDASGTSQNNSTTTSSTGSNGVHNHSFSGSSSHSHNITLNLKYINVIVCLKS